MEDDFCGLACPPLDFGFGELGNYNFSLDNFFDNVGDDDVRVSDANLRNPNTDLGVKQQRSGKNMRLLIKSPKTTVVHGKGKQLPLPHLMTGPEPIKHGKEKQFKILREAHDPNHHSTSEVVRSTNPVIESSIPKVESTKRTGMAKPEDSVVIDSSNSVNIKHSVTGINYDYKLELSKRKLQESYGAAQQAKRQRQIAVLNFHPGSEKPSLQQRSCQGGRFRTNKLQRLYNDCKSRPCLI